MKPAATDSAPQLQFLLHDLAAMLDARQPLYRLAQIIDWTQFETAFAQLYKDEGRPALTQIERVAGYWPGKVITERGYRGRNFLRGIQGDALNLLLAATAANFSLWLHRASARRHAILARLRFALGLRGLFARPLVQTGFKGTTILWFNQ